MIPLKSLLNELCWSTISHFILLRVCHQSLSCLRFDCCHLSQLGFHGQLGFLAVQPVQTEEVNWTIVGDRGWKVLLPLRVQCCRRMRPNLFIVVRAASDVSDKGQDLSTTVYLLCSQASQQMWRMSGQLKPAKWLGLYRHCAFCRHLLPYRHSWLYPVQELSLH